MKDLKKILTFISNSDKKTILQETWSYEVPYCGDEWVFEKPVIKAALPIPFAINYEGVINPETISSVRIIERTFVPKENRVKLYCNIL